MKCFFILVFSSDGLPRLRPNTSKLAGCFVRELLDEVMSTKLAKFRIDFQEDQGFTPQLISKKQKKKTCMPVPVHVHNRLIHK